MRTRTKQSIQNLKWHYDKYNESNSLIQHIDSADILGVGEKQTTCDIVTEHYTKRRKQGEIIINPFTSQRVAGWSTLDGMTLKLGSSDPNVWVTHVWTGPVVSSYIGSSPGDIPVARPVILDSEIDGLISLASTKCWGAVSKSELQLLQTIADAKRTIQMCLSPLGNALSFVRKVRSTKNARAADRSLTTAKYMAREWLTYRYGWSQLYRDVKGILKAVGEHDRSGLLQARGAQKLRKEQTRVVHAKNGTTFQVEVNETITDEVFVKCGLFYDGNLAIDNYLGITKYDVLAAAWDVIPYSFVLDWVLNVQDYLTSLVPFLTIPSKGAYTVVTRNLTLQRVPTGAVTMLDATWVQYGSVVRAPGGFFYSTYRNKTRIVGIRNPSVQLTFNIGDFVDIRVVDSLALILNILRSK